MTLIKDEAVALGQEWLKRFNAFLSWREQEKKKWVHRTACYCIKSLNKPSRASSVHKILFHVCEEHSTQFGIPQGPYWEQDCPADLETVTSYLLSGAWTKERITHHQPQA